MKYHVLASYATFKELYNSKAYINPYQILSEFITYVIDSKGMYDFTVTDIQSELNTEFGFKPPVAVIRTALRGVDYVTKSQSRYQINVREIRDNSRFKECKQKSEKDSKSITDALFKYVGAIYSDQKINKGKLTQQFIQFVLDEKGEDTYHDIISEFIIANSDNNEFVNTLATIREGSILYTGLSYNISEYGSLKNPITLFLDTEILFDICGLNGEIYQILANDLLNLIKAANKDGKKIELKYFDIVEDDIKNYYYRAERIVEGKECFVSSPAMKEITTGCKNASDVSDKQVDFFRKINYELGIRKDTKTNYYTASDEEHNLENELQERYPATDIFNFEGLRFCSHINKLRKGQQSKMILDSQYLFVTDTKKVIAISNALIEAQTDGNNGMRYSDYAVSLSNITNILWFKLNRGFGATAFPKNLDAVIKARVILSGYISQGISNTYDSIKDRYEKQELTDEQAASYIVALSEKPILPEDINSTNVVSSLCFTDDYLGSISETLSTNKQLLDERARVIEALNAEISELRNELSAEVASGEQKQTQIDALEKRINDLEGEVKAKERKKFLWKMRAKFFWAIVWKVAIAVVIVALIRIVCIAMDVDFPTWLGILLSVAGVAIPVCRKDLQQYKESLAENGSGKADL